MLKSDRQQHIKEIQDIADEHMTDLNQKLSRGDYRVNAEIALLEEIIIEQNNLILTQNEQLLDHH